MARRKYVKENNLVKAINTDSLELQKPLVNEYYDINVHNSNMDKIDLGYKQNKNDISNINYELSKTENTKYTTENGIKEFSCKDGYVDNVAIEGKTLVNLADKYSVRTDSGDGISRLYFTQQKRCTNGTYTCFNFADKTIAFNQRTLANDVYVGQTHVSANSCKVVEVNAENVIYGIDFQPEFGWSNEDTSIYTSSMFAVLEGDHTDKPISYFEGLKSVGQGDKIDILSYESNKKHPIDTTGHTWKDGYFIDTESGTEVQLEGYSYTVNYIPITKVLDYIVLDNANAHICFYDENKNYIPRRHEFYLEEPIFSVASIPNNTKFIRYTISTKNKLNHELYQSNVDKKQISTTLRSLPNGVKDTIEKRGNKYVKVQRCGEIVLNGEENWELGGQANDATIKPTLFLTDMNLGNLGNAVDTNLFCDKFKAHSIYDSINLVEGIYISSSNTMHIRISKTKLSSIDLAGFKAWLASNPVTVVYELETPQITELPNFNPQTYSDNTTLLINSGVIQAEADFEVTNSIGSEIGVLKSKVSSLDDTVINEEVYRPILLNGFQTAYSSDNNFIKKIGNMCFMNLSFKNSANVARGTLICKLPSNLKPKNTTRVVATGNYMSHSVDITNDEVLMYQQTSIDITNVNFRLNCCWEVE